MMITTNGKIRVEVVIRREEILKRCAFLQNSALCIKMIIISVSLSIFYISLLGSGGGAIEREKILWQRNFYGFPKFTKNSS